MPKEFMFEEEFFCFIKEANLLIAIQWVSASLQVTVGEIGTKKLRLSFGGKVSQYMHWCNTNNTVCILDKNFGRLRLLLPTMHQSGVHVVIVIYKTQLYNAAYLQSPLIPRSTSLICMSTYNTRCLSPQAVATPIHRRTEQQAHLTIQDMASKSHPVSEDMGTSSAMTHTTPMVSSPSKVTPPKRSVYLKDERVEFPATKVGMKSLMKVRVCNRDPRRYQVGIDSQFPRLSLGPGCCEFPPLSHISSLVESLGQS